MILFVLTGQAPPILIMTLAVNGLPDRIRALEGGGDVQFLWKAWWVLFVVLGNVVGFAIFWIWLARRRVRRTAAKTRAAARPSPLIGRYPHLVEPCELQRQLE